MKIIRAKKKITIGVVQLIGIMLLVAVIIGGFSIFYIYRQDQKSKKEISSMAFQIESTKRLAYVANQSIKMGEELKPDLFSKKYITSSIDQDLFADDVTLSETENETKWALVDVEAGMPILKNMVAVDAVTNDKREEEFGCILLNSNLYKGQYIDVRLMFPNGEDFIVVSKKKLKDLALDKNTAWLWLDEKEILSVSSAIVDAYTVKGSKLYMVKYVAPGNQKASIPTYPVKNSNLSLIKLNPNILNSAKQGLTEAIRNALEARLGKVNTINQTDVQSGVSQEIASRNAKIQADAVKPKSEN